MRKEHRIAAFILLSVVLLSFLPSIWYDCYEKVSWYLFSNNERWIDLVIEDYADLVTFLIIYSVAYRFVRERIIKSAFWFLIILGSLDLIHLALWDMNFELWFWKYLTASGIWLLSRSSMV